MSEEKRPISGDMRLSELTIDEFTALIYEMLREALASGSTAEPRPGPAPDRPRMSLDDFLNADEQGES